MHRHAAFIALCFWVLMTSLWWIFAFWPLSVTAPEWLSAARAACFGTQLGSGLPNAGGWLMLTGAPLSMLVALLVAWGVEIRQSFNNIFHSANRRLLLATIVMLLLGQTFWLAGKVRAGMLIASQDFTSDLSGPLPATYPTRNVPAADFELINQHSEKIKLSQLSSNSSVTIVSFAFANCKTICPAITHNLSAAIEHFDPLQVNLLVITLDPHRDTVGALKSWSDRLKLPANAHLLTGSVEKIEQVLHAYQIPFKRDEQTGDVDHPALTNIIDGKGQIVYALGNVPSQWITDAVARVLGSASTSSKD